MPVGKMQCQLTIRQLSLLGVVIALLDQLEVVGSVMLRVHHSEHACSNMFCQALQSW